MPPADRAPYEPSRRATFGWAALLVALHIALVVHAAHEVAWTADEPNYVGAGHALWTDFAFASPAERLHGPLPYLANQLFVTADGPIDLDAVRFPSRLGMLPFSLLLLASVAGFARELWGRCGMLLALTLASACPILIGYGALVAVDVALGATSTLLFWMLRRHTQQPTLARACSCGAALGVALATKYLAVLFAPFVVLGVVLAARWRRAPAHLAALAFSTLAAWHACYGFAAPALSEPAAFASSLMQGIAAFPLGTTALAILPGPFVLGLDFQLAAAGNYAGTFLDVAGGHPAYYVITLLTKLPLPSLTIVVLALAVRAPRARGLGSALALPVLGMLVYLSLSRMQLGVRYVLPLVPLAYVFAGRVAHSRFVTTRVGRALLVALPLWLCVERIADAPHHLSFFNQLVGRRGGMHLFGDSNCDWGQDRRAGEDELRRRHLGLEALGHDDGPRFGLLARHAAERKRVDPLRPGKTYDWLARFAPIDRHLAAWLVYDVDAGDFRDAIARGDTRAAGELVRAFVHAGDLPAARTALVDVNDAAERDALAAMLDAFDAALASPRDEALVVLAVQRLAMFRLFTPAARLAGGLPRERDALRGQILWEAGRMHEVRDRLLEAKRERTLTVEERFLFAQTMFWTGEFAAALAELDADPPPPEHALRRGWDELRARTAQEAAQSRRLFGR